MDVTPVADDEEVVELRECPRLALVGQEPIRVLRAGRPHRTAQQAYELEDRPPVVGDRAVTDPGAQPGQQELVNQLLLEVLVLLRCLQLLGRPDRPDDHERHRALNSLPRCLHQRDLALQGGADETSAI
ncbi:hypothetical protein [Streptomyces specialis]|uniref:hypothetical protein n=1 Tax=Streptomyces specialis TaxID=498367 RepID=UPI0018FE61B6|nr:hypothetical protein [Streptomyces specialis]